MDDTEKIKLKMDAIWKARDNEVGAIKERSLLIWGFLMFCYTGYACLVAKVVLTHGEENSIPLNRLEFINLILLGISLIAFRLSVYWVEMMKGAKAWAENFDYIAENFQHRFLRLACDRSCPFFSVQFRCSPCGMSQSIPSRKNCYNCKADPSYACTFSVIDPASGYYNEVDESLLTTSGGAFSPAKVTVSIARFSLVISIGLLLAHLLISIVGIDNVRYQMRQIAHEKWAGIALVGIWFILFLVRKLSLSKLLHCIFKSDKISMTLQDNQRIREVFCPTDYK